MHDNEPRTAAAVKSANHCGAELIVGGAAHVLRDAPARKDALLGPLHPYQRRVDLRDRRHRGAHAARRLGLLTLAFHQSTQDGDHSERKCS